MADSSLTEKEEHDEVTEKPKSYGIGIRHLQMVAMYIMITCLIITRGSMGVAVLAMCDSTKKNLPGIHIYDWDKKTQGLILSSFFWGYMIMQIPAGILSKKFGGKPVLLAASVSNGLIYLLIPTLTEWGGWIMVCAARVATGLTQACLFPASQTLLGQWLPANELTSYSGLVYSGIHIGTILSMPLCGILAETSLGWTLIFYVISGLLFINAIIWYFFAASSPREHSRTSIEEREYIEAGLNVQQQNRVRTPWKHILLSKPMWTILAPQMGFAVSFVFFLVDMPTYIEKALKVSLRNSALLSALPYVGSLVGGMAATFISEKLIHKGVFSLTFNRKLFQSISLFGVAAGLVALSFLGPENKLFAVVMLIFSLTMSGFSSAGFIVNQLDLSPNFAGVIYSIVNFFANIGSVFVPIATSLLLKNDPSDISRWRVVFLVLAALTCLANVIYILFATSDRQEWDDPDFLKKKLGEQDELKPVLKEKDCNLEMTKETKC